VRDIVDAHPELLRVLPKRWQRSAVVGAALVAACGIVAARWQATPAQAAGVPSRVAPIFQHGGGLGGFGCVAVNPPVLLSEEEARAIIVDEAKKAGINFQADKRKLTVRKPVLLRASETWQTHRDTLTLDGTDRTLNISYEYMSYHDYESLAKGKYRSSYWGVELLKAAEIIREGLVKEKPRGTYAVFYDPTILYGSVVKMPSNASQLSSPPRRFVEPDDGMRLFAIPSLFIGWGGRNIEHQSGPGVLTLSGNPPITFFAGQAIARVGDKSVDLPYPMIVQGDTPLVPLQWTVSQLGGKTFWDAEFLDVMIIPPDNLSEVLIHTTEITSADRLEIGRVALFTEEYITEANSRETLRQQVRDFITWLKAEGVI
jgi:hypothetical protein